MGNRARTEPRAGQTKATCFPMMRRTGKPCAPRAARRVVKASTGSDCCCSDSERQRHVNGVNVMLSDVELGVIEIRCDGGPCRRYQLMSTQLMAKLLRY